MPTTGNESSKEIRVFMAGDHNVHDFEISPGTTAVDVMEALASKGLDVDADRYQFRIDDESSPSSGCHRINNTEDLFSLVKNEQKLYVIRTMRCCGAH